MKTKSNLIHDQKPCGRSTRQTPNGHQREAKQGQEARGHESQQSSGKSTHRTGSGSKEREADLGSGASLIQFRDWLQQMPFLGPERKRIRLAVEIALPLGDWFTIAECMTRTGMEIGEVIREAIHGLDLLEWSNNAFEVLPNGSPKIIENM